MGRVEAGLLLSGMGIVCQRATAAALPSSNKASNSMVSRRSIIIIKWQAGGEYGRIDEVG